MVNPSGYHTWNKNMITESTEAIETKSCQGTNKRCNSHVKPEEYIQQQLASPQREGTYDAKRVLGLKTATPHGYWGQTNPKGMLKYCPMTQGRM